MTAKTRREGHRKSKKPMLFTAKNYRLMGLGCLLVLIGFTAMYLENEVHGWVSLYLSPVLILLGYLTVVLAIIKRDDHTPGEQLSS